MLNPRVLACIPLAWFAQGVRHWLALRVFPLACERRACVGWLFLSFLEMVLRAQA